MKTAFSSNIHFIRGTRKLQVLLAYFSERNLDFRGIKKVFPIYSFLATYQRTHVLLSISSSIITEIRLSKKIQRSHSAIRNQFSREHMQKSTLELKAENMIQAYSKLHTPKYIKRLKTVPEIASKCCGKLPSNAL